MRKVKIKNFLKNLSPCIGGICGGIATSSYLWIFLMPISLVILWNGFEKNKSNFLWGFSFVALSHFWLLHLHPLTWIGFSWVTSIVLTIFIWLGVSSLGGLLVSLWGFIGKILFSQKTLLKQNNIELIVNLFLICCLWAFGELLLSQTPFYWISLGETLIPGDLYLSGLARWFGAPGLTIIQLLIGYWIFFIYKSFNLRQNIKKSLLKGILIISFLHLVGFFLIFPVQNVSKYPVSIWQTNIPTRKKSNISNKKMKEAFSDSQEKALSQNAKLFIAPEGTLRTNFTFDEPVKIDTLIGGFREDKKNIKSSLLVFLKSEKNYSNSKDKYRTVPLGEKVPSFLDIFGNGLSSIGGIQSGVKSRYFQINGGNISPLAVAICYEISDGINLSNAVKKGSKLIVSILNLDPYPSKLQAQFLSLARIRTIENNRDLVLAANTGPSGLIRSDGRIDMLFDTNQEDIQIVFPSLLSHMTFYTKFGNKPLFCIFLFFLFSRKFTYQAPS